MDEALKHLVLDLAHCSSFSSCLLRGHTLTFRGSGGLPHMCHAQYLPQLGTSFAETVLAPPFQGYDGAMWRRVIHFT